MLAAQRLPQAGRAGVRSLELRKLGGISTLCHTRTDLAKSFHVATAARTTRGCGLLSRNGSLEAWGRCWLGDAGTASADSQDSGLALGGLAKQEGGDVVEGGRGARTGDAER